MLFPTIILLLSFRVIGANTLGDRLFLNFLPPNAAANAIAPPSIFFAETPIVVRYTLIGGIATYEPRAACHSQALSFFGTRDQISSTFCNEPNISILTAYTVHRALQREFPTEAASYATFLQTLGLSPSPSATDTSTLQGWANVIGKRLADYFANDGWNSLGERSRTHFRMPFEDFTNYTPSNRAGIPPRSLVRPLRWQPLPVARDRLGSFGTQIHVVPHIGRTANPLVITREELENRKVPPPYMAPSRTSGILEVDKMAVRGYINELLNRSTTLTPMQRFLARWWNNKLLSTAALSTYYSREAHLNRFEVAQQFMGEMMAQHDALLLAWKEKRRHDLARPRSIMQHILAGQTVRTFISEETGVGDVRVEEWRPLLNEQPHSEFPSGSAAICTAAMEHIQAYVRRKVGNVPEVRIHYPAHSMPFPQPNAVTVLFGSAMQAAKSCGESRLAAGVHFAPAVREGERLGVGIGLAAFRHVIELGEGRVPAVCARCR